MCARRRRRRLLVFAALRFSLLPTPAGRPPDGLDRRRTRRHTPCYVSRRKLEPTYVLSFSGGERGGEARQAARGRGGYYCDARPVTSFPPSTPRRRGETISMHSTGLRWSAHHWSMTHDNTAIRRRRAYVDNKKDWTSASPPSTSTVEIWPQPSWRTGQCDGSSTHDEGGGRGASGKERDMRWTSEDGRRQTRW